MKHKLLLLSISLIVIFSMVAGLTTSSAQAPQPATQTAIINPGMTADEVTAALPAQPNFILQRSTVGNGCLLESIFYQL